MLEANELCFNVKALPFYNFDKAEIIVSFAADFLGTWILPSLYTNQYSQNKNISKENPHQVKHIQFETNLSLTGCNADKRIPIKPSEELSLLKALYERINNNYAKTQDEYSSFIDELGGKLLKNKGKSIIISGSNDLDIQLIVNKINYVLDNYSKTISINKEVYVRQGIDSQIYGLLEKMEKQEVKNIIFYNVNPLYDYPEADRFKKALEKMDLVVSLNDTLDETSNHAHYICPDNHYLESWNDAEPVKNNFSLCQPVINKLFNTRQAQESLLKWSGNKTTYTDYIKGFWNVNIYDSGLFATFDEYWTDTLRKGVYVKTSSDNTAVNFILNDSIFSSAINSKNNVNKDNSLYEYTLYENIGIGTGRHSNNPWLQELPDPVSKVCWDNFLAVSHNSGKKLGLENGDIVKIKIEKTSLELPVLIQPGQADNTASLALGYGRTHTGKVGKNVGVNGFKLLGLKDKKRMYSGTDLNISKTGKNYILALTQIHHSQEKRPLIREAKLSEYKKNPHAGNELHEENVKKQVDLYPKREFKGHHWGMTIDLNKCTGCSSCVIACQAENNIPVIGRDEIRKQRIMHWLRIDRYYSENPVSPDVSFQPVSCQHCNIAPCENVCPVEATQNSTEGLNEMVYNRCVGTKYCINNCPYRVRRFNWLAYNSNDQINSVHYDLSVDNLSRMQLNPDVVVRSRGVVEKCTLCIQRIQEKKLLAKKENRKLRDAEIMPACLQACPAECIVFGDRNNKDSRVNEVLKDERMYYLLEYLNTKPTTAYLTKIRNDV